ncbi:MAG: type II toxin-antitoxin system YafQ family toxin [Chthoniobacterales bacterium]|nr:type II toxin-antitoxin system YafQ family toxin [Chthoniobacterales bacterium]
MKAIYETSQFRKDLKKLRKQGKDIDKLKAIVSRITAGQPLEARCRDHALTGSLKGSRDCHIEPDWLLIYRVDDESLFLERSGTHSDLFKK